MSFPKNPLHKPRYIDSGDMADDVEGPWLPILGYTRVGFQAVWTIAEERDVPVAASDSVTALTKTWVFAGADFAPTDVGGTFTISGTDSGNDGDYEVASVVDETTITTVEAPAADESFDGTETASVLPLPAVGEFAVQVSFDGLTVADGKDAPTGNLGPTDLTLPSSMTDAFPDGTSSDFVFEFEGMTAPWIRFVYVPEEGGGTLKVGATGKGF